MKNGLFIDLHDNQYRFLNDELHCEDGPAVITKDSKQWFLYGVGYDPVEWMLKVYEMKQK